MKANAPEKIYLSSNENGTHYYTEGIPFEREYVEYIRTDAFVENAIKWIKEHADDYDYTWYNEMIGESGITDKMIEDFREYMEGK